MNKILNNKKLIVIAFIAIIIIIYLVILIIAINRNNLTIQDYESKNKSLMSKIATEKKNQKMIKGIDPKTLKNVYFDRDNEYFENYIRELFNKYNIKIDAYHSRIDEKDYSEINVSFIANAFNFFKLIKDLERGEKLVVIKRININKSIVPDLKVNIVFRGYYKN